MPQINKTIIKFNFIVEFIDFKRINANYSMTNRVNYAKIDLTSILSMSRENYVTWHQYKAGWQIINDAHYPF
jgi:hypothetical protein